MARSTPDIQRPPEWASALRRQMEAPIGWQLRTESKLPQELPPEPASSAELLYVGGFQIILEKRSTGWVTASMQKRLSQADKGDDQNSESEGPPQIVMGRIVLVPLSFNSYPGQRNATFGSPRSVARMSARHAASTSCSPFQLPL